MSIATELTRLSGNLTALNTVSEYIRAAIVAKGGTSPSGHTFKDFAADIATIPYEPVESEYLILNGVPQQTFDAWAKLFSSLSGAAYAPTITEATGYLRLNQYATATRQGIYRLSTPMTGADLSDYSRICLEFRRKSNQSTYGIGFGTYDADTSETYLKNGCYDYYETTYGAVEDTANQTIKLTLNSGSTSGTSVGIFVYLRGLGAAATNHLDIYNMWLE